METLELQDFFLRSAKAKTLTRREMLDERRDEFSRYRRMGRYLTAKYIGAMGLGLTNNYLKTDKFISNGGEQLVFGTDEEVKKVIYSTLCSDGISLEAKLDQFKRQENQCRAYMGDYWLCTDYAVQKVLPRHHAIIATQPKLGTHIAFDAPEAIAELLKEFPGLRYEVLHFTAGVKRLHNNTGLYPDILGPGNLVLALEDSERLKLMVIDNIPADAERQYQPTIEDPTKTRGETIAEKLQALQSAANAA